LECHPGTPIFISLLTAFPLCIHFVCVIWSRSTIVAVTSSLMILAFGFLILNRQIWSRGRGIMTAEEAVPTADP
jgi:hypothetical protein